MFMEKIDIYENKNVDWISKIKLYKEIFWDPPWEEWFICKNCNWIYPKRFMWSCKCWKSVLEPYYKNKEVKKYFKDLSYEKNYKELVINILNKDIWFTWWWNTSLDNLNNNNLKLSEQQIIELKNFIISKYNDFDAENFYYFAEIWVKKEFRWKDFAWDLYCENLEKLKERWEKYIIVRTTKKSDIPYKWFLKLGYEEIFQYNDMRNRIVLICKI